MEELFAEEHSVSMGQVVGPSLTPSLNLEEQTFLPALLQILVSGEEEEGEEEEDGRVYE